MPDVPLEVAPPLDLRDHGSVELGAACNTAPVSSMKTVSTSAIALTKSGVALIGGVLLVWAWKRSKVRVVQ